MPHAVGYISDPQCNQCAKPWVGRWDCCRSGCPRLRGKSPGEDASCCLGAFGTSFDASQAMSKAMPPRSQAVVVIDVGEELHTGGPTGGPRTLLDVPTSHCSRRFVM